MSHTAVDLFPGWYTKGINREPSPTEFNIRKKAIADIVKSNDVGFWLNLLKVYLGTKEFNSTEYNQIVEAAKKGDENFNIQDVHLVRLLSGCSIAQKIEANGSHISYLLALGLLTTEIKIKEAPLLNELLARSQSFWATQAEQKRKMQLDFQLGKGDLKSVTKIEIPDITSDPATWKTHSDAVVKSISGLQKDLNTTNTEINTKITTTLETIKRNFVALAEETDVLWWLFGGYSSLLKKSFSKISPEMLSLLVGFELNQLTHELPGIGGVESIIHRALSHVEFEAGSKHSLEKIFESIKGHEEQFSQFIPANNTDLQILTPYLFAASCRSNFAGSEWKTVYQKEEKIDLATETTYEHFALQLYMELMLARVYKHLKN